MVDDIIKFSLGCLGIIFSGYGIYVLTRRDSVLETSRKATEKRDAELLHVRLDLANLRGQLKLPPYPYPGD